MLLKESSLPFIRFSDHLIKDGVSFFKEAKKLHLEGVIGKKLTSTYQSRRSSDWVKIKTSLRQEVVICGFTAPRGSRKKFGALLMGIYDGKRELSYVGHVGGGFDSKLLNDTYETLKPLIQEKCPFKKPPKTNAPFTWLKPKLVCEVSFAQWTKDNLMRQPIFKGLRMDKSPKDIKKEIPEQISNKKENKKQKFGKELTLTNLDKIYWPKENFTKGDLLDYYETISPFILPYLKDRPIMLHRYPDGIEGKDFYQKDIAFSHPEWVRTYPVQHEGKVDHYLLINDLRSLLYAVNLGSIDLHPFMSRYKTLDKPDYCVIDLDPHDISFDKLIECALETHKILDEIGINHYCKTSGGKGLHIMIPLHAKYDYEQSKQFALLIATCIHERLPKTTSLDRDPKKRPKKIYLDYLQNRTGQTIVAPYSVRPRPKALVSTPLLWKEVNKNLDITQFNIQTIPTRLRKIGDSFKPIMGAGVNIKKTIATLQTMLL